MLGLCEGAVSVHAVRFQDIARIALGAPCLLAGETVHPRYRHDFSRGRRLVVTLNSGYE